MKNAFRMALLIAVFYGGWQMYEQIGRQASYQEQEKVKDVYAAGHDTNAEVMGTKTGKVIRAMNKTKKVNLAAIAASVDDEIDMSVNLDNNEEARLARLQHRVPTTAMFINPVRSGWTPVRFIPAGVRLRVAGSVQGVGPDGAFSEGKPQSMGDSLTIMEVLRQERDPTDKGWDPYREFLLWSEHDPMPFHFHDGDLNCRTLGESKTLYNELARVSGGSSTRAFNYNQGEEGFSFWVEDTPETRVACGMQARANP